MAFFKKQSKKGGSGSSRAVGGGGGPVSNMGVIAGSVQHVGHAGFNEKTGGFEMKNLPPDLQSRLEGINNALQAMGVDQLTQEEMKLVLRGDLKDLAKHLTSGKDAPLISLEEAREKKERKEKMKNDPAVRERALKKKMRQLLTEKSELEEENKELRMELEKRSKGKMKFNFNKKTKAGGGAVTPPPKKKNKSALDRNQALSLGLEELEEDLKRFQKRMEKTKPDDKEMQKSEKRVTAKLEKLHIQVCCVLAVEPEEVDMVAIKQKATPPPPPPAAPPPPPMIMAPTPPPPIARDGAESEDGGDRALPPPPPVVNGGGGLDLSAAIKNTQLKKTETKELKFGEKFSLASQPVNEADDSSLLNVIASAIVNRREAISLANAVGAADSDDDSWSISDEEDFF